MNVSPLKKRTIKYYPGRLEIGGMNQQQVFFFFSRGKAEQTREEWGRGHSYAKRVQSEGKRWGEEDDLLRDATWEEAA